MIVRQYQKKVNALESRGSKHLMPCIQKKLIQNPKALHTLQTLQTYLRLQLLVILNRQKLGTPGYVNFLKEKEHTQTNLTLLNNP